MRIEDVWGHFNPILSDFGSAILAGGCVRDQLMGRAPKDFDLFILSDKKEFSFKEAKEEVIGRLNSFDVAPKSVEWHNSEPFLVASLLWAGSEVQIMLSPARTLKELIATFDWSVCLFGFDGESVSGGDGIAHIKEGNELSLQKISFPLSTLRRGFRFSERFKMKLKSADVEELCRQILEKAARGNRKGPRGNEPDMPALAAQMTEEMPF